MHWLYSLLETDLIPEPIIRLGIRRMLSEKIKIEKCNDPVERELKLKLFAEELRRMPLAIETDAANKQHYEVPTEFYLQVLGPRLKYSCALWNESTRTLADAETAMLEASCERAELQNGMHILELGCGWGSLSLFMAEKYPSSTIVAISNSRTQKEFIDSKIAERGLNNLSIITADIRNFDIEDKFDRVVSVEMFEHLKNYELLFERISKWLEPNGKLFVHVFSHKDFAYHYENEDGNDWLTEYFFTGGTMPANALFSYFQKDLSIEKQWEVNGTNYERTSNEWLANAHRHRATLEPILANTYGKDQTRRWWVYWKLFFLACAELWGYKNGTEWMVSHYLFSKKN